MRLPRALIGSTGFVGQALRGAGAFDALYHRADIDSIRGRRFGTLICAGLPAEKWRANRAPAADLANMEHLCAALGEVECERLVLISTVDVYGRPEAVSESDLPDLAAATAYGRHRGLFERFAREREGRGFARVQILRLPGLFGPGLRKNLVFDLIHRAPGLRVARRGRFQWYPIVRLQSDIERLVAADLDLLHLFPEPIETARLLGYAFPDLSHGLADADPALPVANYDARTEHAALFGRDGGYVMSADEVLAELKRYVDAEAASAVQGV
jgi:hypothetical protein